MIVQQEFEKYMEACHGSDWLETCPIQQIKQKREAFFGGVILGFKLYIKNYEETLAELRQYAEQLTQRL